MATLIPTVKVVVVLSDPAKKQYAAQSLSEGAMDYVLKGFMDGERLAGCCGPRWKAIRSRVRRIFCAIR